MPLSRELRTPTLYSTHCCHQIPRPFYEE